MQQQVTLHFISLKNTISRLEQIEPLVTIVLRLVRLVRVESPLSRLEQVVSIGHVCLNTTLERLSIQTLYPTSPCQMRFSPGEMQVSAHTAQVNSVRVLWLATHTQESIVIHPQAKQRSPCTGFLPIFQKIKQLWGRVIHLGELPLTAPYKPPPPPGL